MYLNQPLCQNNYSVLPQPGKWQEVLSKRWTMQGEQQQSNITWDSQLVVINDHFQIKADSF